MACATRWSALRAWSTKFDVRHSRFENKPLILYQEHQREDSLGNLQSSLLSPLGRSFPMTSLTTWTKLNYSERADNLNALQELSTSVIGQLIHWGRSGNLGILGPTEKQEWNWYRSKSGITLGCTQLTGYTICLDTPGQSLGRYSS